MAKPKTPEALEWQVGVWDRISDIYVREIDQRFVPVVQALMQRAKLLCILHELPKYPLHWIKMGEIVLRIYAHGVMVGDTFVLCSSILLVGSSLFLVICYSFAEQS